MRGENWRRHKVGMSTVITPAQVTAISDCLLKLNNKVASAQLHKSIHKSTTKLSSLPPPPNSYSYSANLTLSPIPCLS
jgi:hypothetical protein